MTFLIDRGSQSAFHMQMDRQHFLFFVFLLFLLLPHSRRIYVQVHRSVTLLFALQKTALTASELQHILYKVPNFLVYKLTEQTNRVFSMKTVLMRIFCSQYLLEVQNPWTSQNVVSSLEILCQAFTAASFSCCLFAGLSALSFAFTN